MPCEEVKEVKKVAKDDVRQGGTVSVHKVLDKIGEIWFSQYLENTQ